MQVSVRGWSMHKDCLLFTVGKWAFYPARTQIASRLLSYHVVAGGILSIATIMYAPVPGSLTSHWYTCKHEITHIHTPVDVWR